jgi:two-component system sensor histidine kinase RegB
LAVLETGLLDHERRSNWVRLRTLIVLRWTAIGGQLAVITIAQQVFHLDINLGLCFVAVGASVIANLIAIFVYPRNKRLSENEVTLMLVFDVIQLTALLFLTGGLHNPFAMLILAPVAIAATALRARATVIVGIVAIATVTLVLWFHVPLRTDTDEIIQMPQIFVFGFWVAIVIGVIFIGAYARRVASEINSMSEALLATQMALSREQKIVDLAGVVAAAAHELGTPLATIKLASSELMEELVNNPELLEDAQLIRDQTDRCRDILRSMGRAGKEDLLLRHAPLTAVIREAAEPHTDRGKVITITANSSAEQEIKQPTILRKPEIIHGLRNLIQNAVDFSRAHVSIEASWNDKFITIRIADDGIGFPAHVIDRIGDPFLRDRRSEESSQLRPEYQGMGLGLFIAKTLLERSGAELTFVNGSNDSDGQSVTGAIVQVVWPLELIDSGEDVTHQALGENRLIEV